MARAKSPYSKYNDLIFSLDIGTRNVVGMLARKADRSFHVLDYEFKEHPDRSMYDGQIHDIEKVVEVVRHVKEKLEERSKLKLKKVAIAAAGRALKTSKVMVEREMEAISVITKDVMDNLEMEGIQKAQAVLDSGEDQLETKYYCVGYTVINYYLDGSLIQNPRDHKGTKLKADIIATFLPHIVVDSLYTVVDRVGLEVVSMTLEPIAAINIAIPPKFRLLNLALVDVGAGTSDIALTQGGTITSYAMVAEAGDEITEAIAQAFLLDFESAELLKIQLMQQDTHVFTDIVGIEYKMATEEVLKRLEPILKRLTGHIASQIIEFNGKSPSAVFCIGGGCRVPGFTGCLAEALELPSERVVIKGAEALEDLYYETEPLVGPEYVTPVGIGFTAIREQHRDFLIVEVNGKEIRLFNSKQLTVSDALILIGFNARKLIARRGESISITFNGQKKTIFGEHGQPAVIRLNGEASSLDAKIKNNDTIEVSAAQAGEKAKASVSDLVDYNRKIVFQKLEVPLVCVVKINGEAVSAEVSIESGDVVETRELKTIADFIEFYEVGLETQELLLNGKPARRSNGLKPGDVLSLENRKMREEPVKVREMQREEQVVYMGSIPVTTPSIPDVTAFNFVVNGKPVQIHSPKSEMVFVDIFDHIPFDRTAAKGILGLTLNGRRANYLDSLKSGDVIDIFWK